MSLYTVLADIAIESARELADKRKPLSQREIMARRIAGVMRTPLSPKRNG